MTLKLRREVLKRENGHFTAQWDSSKYQVDVLSSSQTESNEGEVIQGRGAEDIEIGKKSEAGRPKYNSSLGGSSKDRGLYVKNRPHLHGDTILGISISHQRMEAGAVLGFERRATGKLEIA
jgi:hypothetical protein